MSMIGAASDEVAQPLNSLIQPCLNASYLVKSTNEIVVYMKDLNAGKSLVSFNVISWITNIPAADTMKISVRAPYGRPVYHLCYFPRSPSNMFPKTPFSFQNAEIVQTDVMSMGSTLGPR